MEDQREVVVVWVCPRTFVGTSWRLIEDNNNEKLRSWQFQSRKGWQRTSRIPVGLMELYANPISDAVS
jgi:hypothetical protein